MLEPQSTAPLARLETARRLLAEARTIDEVKTIRDTAEQMRLYAQQARLGLEAQNSAAEIKLRAERRAGEMLKVAPKHPGAARPRTPWPADMALPPKLSDIGVSPKQSSNWQAMAAIPEPAFDAHVAATKENGQELTTVSTVRLARQLEQADAEQRQTNLEDRAGITDDPHIETLRVRAAASRHMKSIGELSYLDPAVLASTYTEGDWKTAQHFINRLRDWCDRLEAEATRPTRERLTVVE